MTSQQYRVALDLGLEYSAAAAAALEEPSAAYHHHPHHGHAHHGGHAGRQPQPMQHDTAGKFGTLAPQTPQGQHQQQQQQRSPAAPGGDGERPQGGGGGQFGILAPAALPQGPFEGDGGQNLGDHNAERSHGPLSGKIVVDPPDLQAWREKLFHVDEMIVLTNEQFETYFPHVDNVYSHRSTQRYKRKPFVSHYWDCRMKGRPPGTPKSDDPSKKKRKRTARERDLCDVKIKITEYSAGAQIQLEPSADGISGSTAPQSYHPLEVGPGQRFWTIQRVNGNGGNGKGDGVAGPHKHTLARSDEIKKNSVQRFLANQDKETKKTQKTSQRKATGVALLTIKKHAKENDFKLYAACFCPFSQRVWIALEAKGIAYQYYEMDPYRKPSELLEANPRGMVPALRQGNWACAESAVILEYLEDLDQHVPLYPSDPRLKANCRLWVDHINSYVVPAFFSLLRAQDMSTQGEATEQLQSAITSMVLAADEQGPFFLGSSLSLVDIHFAPFAQRLARVLQPLRGWAEPLPGTRWQRWLEALEGNPHIKATTNGREFYADTTDLLQQKLPNL